MGTRDKRDFLLELGRQVGRRLTPFRPVLDLRELDQFIDTRKEFI